MAWFLGQSLLFIVLAFLLGLLVGWLIWGRRAPLAGGRQHARPVSEPGVAPVPAPVALTEPVPAEPEPAAAPAAAEREPATAEPEPDAALEPEPGVAETEAAAVGPAAVEPASAAAEPAVAGPTEPVVDEPVEPEPVVEPVGQPAPGAVEQPDAEPVAVAAPADTPSAPTDDLKRIEGIGPKISGVLVTAGIRTFADLAATELPHLIVVLREGGVRFAPSMSTWSDQADLLAKGDEAGFTALTSLLVAGRKSR